VLAVGWASGPFNVHGQYTRLSYGTASGDLKRDNWLIGGQYSMGLHRLRIQYQVAQDTKGAIANNGGVAIGGVSVATVNGVATGSDTGADVISLSWGYALSKRTEVYGFYSRLDNDRNGRIPAAGTGATQPAGAFSPGMNLSYIGLGINHTF